VMLATIGILAARHRRAATGEGEHGQGSLREAAYALMPNYVVSVLNGEPNYSRQGSGHPQLVPYQAFETADQKYIVVGAFHRASWRALCKSIGREDLMEDDRFRENWDRVKHRKKLEALLKPVFRAKTRQDWLTQFEGDKVMAAPVLSIKESMAFFDSRIDGLFLETQHQTLGTLREVRMPIRFSSKPEPVRRAAPTLGQDTREALREIGFTDAEIDAWKTERLV